MHRGQRETSLRTEAPSSLAHEYAHFLSSRRRADVTILQRYKRYPDHERLANSFAQTFLMPADGVTRRVNEVKVAKGGKFTYADICNLAYYYGVSIEALTRQLEDLKLAGAGAWEKLKASGFKASEARAILGIASPPAVDDLLPPRYRFIALEGYRDGKLSEGQLARFLKSTEWTLAASLRNQARREMTSSMLI